MIFLIAFLVTIWHIAFSSQLHLWGGSETWLPALIIMSAAFGWSKHYVLWWICLIVTTYFAPLSVAEIIILFFFSGASWLIFTRWVDRGNTFFFTTLVTLLIILYIGVTYSMGHFFSLSVWLGSFLATLPVFVVALVSATWSQKRARL